MLCQITEAMIFNEAHARIIGGLRDALANEVRRFLATQEAASVLAPSRNVIRGHAGEFCVRLSSEGRALLDSHRKQTPVGNLPRQVDHRTRERRNSFRVVSPGRSGRGLKRKACDQPRVGKTRTWVFAKQRRTGGKRQGFVMSAPLAFGSSKSHAETVSRLSLTTTQRPSTHRG